MFTPDRLPPSKRVKLSKSTASIPIYGEKQLVHKRPQSILVRKKMILVEMVVAKDAKT